MRFLRGQHGAARLKGRGLAARLSDFSMTSLGVRRRATSFDRGLLRELEPDEEGYITTTDIAAGGLKETAQRLLALADLGFGRLWVNLVDSGYGDAQLGHHSFAAGRAPVSTMCSPPDLAYAAPSAVPTSDADGLELAEFLRQLQAWTQVMPVCVTVCVARSAEGIAELTARRVLPRSHVIAAYGLRAEASARALSATGHPGGLFALYGEWVSHHSPMSAAARG